MQSTYRAPRLSDRPVCSIRSIASIASIGSIRLAVLYAFAALAVLCAFAALAGCGGPEASLPPRAPDAPVAGSNALAPNALAPNAPAPNALAPNALAPNAPAPNAFAPAPRATGGTSSPAVPVDTADLLAGPEVVRKPPVVEYGWGLVDDGVTARWHTCLLKRRCSEVMRDAASKSVLGVRVVGRAHRTTASGHAMGVVDLLEIRLRE